MISSRAAASLVVGLCAVACSSPRDTSPAPRSSEAASALVARDAGPFVVSDSGSCPTFHCTPEGTGLMTLPVPTGVGAVLWDQDAAVDDGTLNVPNPQSCSSDGVLFNCLYKSGSVTALAMDAPTLKPDFALDGGANAGSLDEYGTSATVAVIGQDRSLIMADDHRVFRMLPSGEIAWTTPVSNAGPRPHVYGVTPLTLGGATFIAVTYRAGVIDVYDASNGNGIASLDVTVQHPKYTAASSPAAHENSLYYVGYDGTSQGVLLRVELKEVKSGASAPSYTFTEQASFGFTDKTGASPVYLADGIGPNGVHEPVVLVDVPVGEGDTGGIDAGSGPHLVALEATHLTRAWATALEEHLSVSPVVDPNRGGVWLYPGGSSATYLAHVAPDGGDAGTLQVQTLVGHPALIGGHIFASSPPNGGGSTYVLGVVGPTNGGPLNQAVVFDVTNAQLTFDAPLNALDHHGYNGALPLITLPDGGPGFVVPTTETPPKDGSPQRGTVAVVGVK